jgi:hypothetical protein
MAQLKTSTLMAFVKGCESTNLSGAIGVHWVPPLRRSRIVVAVWIMTVTLGSPVARAETAPTDPSLRDKTVPTETGISSPDQQNSPGATQPLGSSIVEPTDGSDIQYQQDLTKARSLKKIGLVIGAGSYLGLVTFVSAALLMPVVLGGKPSSENAKVSHILPLYVPLVGPVWSLSYSDVNKDRAAWFWYGLLGAGQIAGTAIYVTGVVKTPSSSAHKSALAGLTMTPLFDGRGQHGIAVMGRF